MRPGVRHAAFRFQRTVQQAADLLLRGLCTVLFLFFLQEQSYAGNPGFALNGPYTINQTQPTAGTNFNSFTDFSTALTTQGITGNVVATVAPGTGH